jgi:hypothetical protein
MLDISVNSKIDESMLPAGDKLAARCAIAALALLRSVGKAYGKPLEEITPYEITNWAVYDWQCREAAAHLKIKVEDLTVEDLEQWQASGQTLQAAA